MSADLSKANRASAYLSDEIIVPWPDSTRLLVRGSRDDIQVGMRQIHQSDTRSADGVVENPEVTVYDTLGRYADPAQTIDVLAGLPPIRNAWIEERGDTDQLDGRSSHLASDCDSSSDGRQERHVNVVRTRRAYRGGTVTQLHYARKGLITPEMEYVAIRENCGFEPDDDEAGSLQNKAGELSAPKATVITPEFVRNEIACGRAVIPNNVNHPETEPMIIGKNFGVKVAACLHPCAEITSMVDEIAQIILALQSGADTVLEFSHHSRVADNRDWVLRNSSIPVGTVPLIHALKKVDGDNDALTWKIYRDTIIEHAEQGVDYVNLFIGNQFPNMTTSAVNHCEQGGGDSTVMSGWKSNRALIKFLPAHFDEICDIMRAYDVTLMLQNELPTQTNSDDKMHVGALELRIKLVNIAWCSDVQVMTNCVGSSDDSRLSLSEIMDANVKECSEAPTFSFFQPTNEKISNAEHFAQVLNTAQKNLMGNALLCCAASPIEIGREPGAANQDLMMCSQVAHTINLANGQPAAWLRENAMLVANAEQRKQDYFNLSVNPELARQMYA